MFWQIPDGEEILRGHLPTAISYAIASGPLLSQEWLYEAAIAWFAQHHAYGSFAFACALAAAATPLLVYAIVRAFGIGDVSAGIAAFLVVGSRFAGSATRPETFAVDAFAIEVLLLARGRRSIFLVPCVVFWANVHASVVLAPIVAFVFLVSRLWIAGGIAGIHVRRSIVSAAVVTVATLITPHGIALWSYAFALALAANPAREHLDAWRALSFDVPGALLGVLPGLLILVCCGAVVRKNYSAELALAALVLVMTIAHARYAMFLSVAWAPAIARTVDIRNFRGTARGRPRASILALAPIAMYAAFACRNVFATPVDPPGVWQSAARIVAERRLTGNAYAPYVWAAYLHWRGLPLHLLIDGHGDPYPREVWDDHLALENVHANWREVLHRRAISIVMAPHDSALAQTMLLEPHWQRIEGRSGVDVFTISHHIRVDETRAGD